MQFDRDEYKVITDPAETELALHAHSVTGWRSGEVINDRGDRGRLHLPEPDTEGRLHLDITALEGLARCIKFTQEIDLKQREHYRNTLNNSLTSRQLSIKHVERLRTAIEESEQNEKIGNTILTFIDNDACIGFMKLDQSLARSAGLEEDMDESEIVFDPSNIIVLAERRRMRRSNNQQTEVL